jgi:hypothetical protein
VFFFMSAIVDYSSGDGRSFAAGDRKRHWVAMQLPQSFAFAVRKGLPQRLQG